MEDTKGSAQPEASSAAKAEDKVAYDTYKRVLSEAKKFKELAETLQKERDSQQETKLKEQNEWKTIAELSKQKLEQVEKALSEKERAIQEGLKYSEFQRHLGGKLRHQSYAGHIDFEKIVINPETGSVDEGSVKSVVSEFLKEHTALVDFGDKGRMPNVAGKVSLPVAKKPSEMKGDEIAESLKQNLSSILK